jgi:FkbM family methyltransferase
VDKVFIDCGFYHGKTVEKYLSSGEIDKSWRVIAFDPATYLNQDLDRLGIPIEMHRSAVWVKDKKLRFMKDWRDDAGHLVRVLNRGDGMSTTVQGIDFSKFVKNLGVNGIICSMDIEGAEFEVLRKMLREGTINQLSILDIEFHHRLRNDWTDKDAENLISRIKDCGVEVRLKVPLW